MTDHWSSTRTNKIKGLTANADFHSFRRLVTQELMEHGQPRYLIDQLTGHKDTSMSTGVYGGTVTLSKLAEIVELLDFSEEVDALRAVGV